MVWRVALAICWPQRMLLYIIAPCSRYVACHAPLSQRVPAYSLGRCCIEEFDQERQQYLIVWKESRGEKWVKRLNLRLEDEEPGTFRARLHYARRMREEVGG